ncbi:MAG TPA: phosphate ABC transporter permease PstA, partial [bacterium]|nr:phosphate ABC transporter permease PstA [bacterium]
MNLAVRRKLWEFLGLSLVRLSIVTVASAMLVMVGFLVYSGWAAISWEFLTEQPRDAMTRGGIFPAIVGTFYLTLGAIIVSFPLGVISAIYLNEYARSGRVIRVIRFGINSLAGVPSVVFGLFGLAVFVVTLGFGSSILSGSLTLGLLILPVIIGASEEALRAVPMAYREASLALGATKWQTIYKVVLPA